MVLFFFEKEAALLDWLHESFNLQEKQRRSKAKRAFFVSLQFKSTKAPPSLSQKMFFFLLATCCFICWTVCAAFPLHFSQRVKFFKVKVVFVIYVKNMTKYDKNKKRFIPFETTCCFFMQVS